MLNFSRRTDHQLIAGLGVGRVNCVCRQFQYTCSLPSQGSDPKPGERFDHVNDSIGIIQINQVERKEYAESMDSSGWNYPEAAIDRRFYAPDQPFETEQRRIRNRNP